MESNAELRNSEEDRKSGEKFKAPIVNSYFISIAYQF